MKVARATVQDLKSEIQRIQTAISNKNTDIESLLQKEKTKQIHLQDEICQSKNRLEQLQNQTRETHQAISECLAQLETLKAQQKKQADDQALPLQRARAAYDHGSLELSTSTPSPPSTAQDIPSQWNTPRSSMSSGVKVSLVSDLVEEWGED